MRRCGTESKIVSQHKVDLRDETPEYIKKCIKNDFAKAVRGPERKKTENLSQES
jgi:hypothetical protein